MKSLIVSAILAAAGFIGQTSSADVVVSAPIIVMAQAKVKPGMEQAFKKAAAEILAPTRNEEGNISYLFVQSTQDPTSFATTEIWKSQAAIDQHIASAHMQAFFKAVGGLFAPGFPVITEYQAFEK